MKIIINAFLLILFVVGSINAQNDQKAFFTSTEAFLSSHVVGGKVNYKKAKNSATLKSLIADVESVDLAGANDEVKKAYYINAYNLQVINQVAKNYPITSPMDITGFFDSKKVTVSGKKMTLNKLEKNLLLKPYQDARLHFVLVCGALGCPPITNFAYLPGKLDMQMEQQTRLALNDPIFVKANSGQVKLSQIFKWYTEDFGGSRSNIIEFINKYRETGLSPSTKISHYPYDWTLNEIKGSMGSSSTNQGGNTGANSARYIVSSTIAKGTFEIKLFNNLYSQKTGSENNLTDRSSFFTTTISVLYGLNDRLNIGLNTRVRKVRNQSLPSSAFEVFGSDDFGSSRSGFTAIGPQIRYAPIPSWENFSIQSSFVFPIGSDLAGSVDQPYIDWTGATWNTQLFNDFTLGNSFSLFTELDFLLEDIGSSDNNHINRFSTPVTTILSYNPNKKITLYTIAGYSPYWQSDFDYFIQGGIGTKYQFSPKLELELLYTKFSNQFLAESGGQAATYNLGLRFNI